MILWILFFTGLFIWKYLKIIWSQGTGELPPGPFPLPIIGNGLNIDSKKPLESVEKLVKKHGKIISLLLGNQLTIFIADVQLLRKAFKDERFSARPKTIWNYLGFSDGIVLTAGDVYKEHRRFAIQSLKDYGFGRQSGEAFIQKESSDLLKTFRDNEGQLFNNHVPLSAAVSNVISYMLFGDRFDPTDRRLVEYIEQESENFRDAASGSLIETYPLLRFIPPFRRKFQLMQKRIEAQRAKLEDVINDHKRTVDFTNPRDYIDTYLVRQKAGVPSFTDWQLQCNVADMYGAAMETTTTFLRWALLLMILHPDVQRKVQAEIDRIVGRARALSIADRATLPYLEATIHEVFRFANFSPFLLPHKTSTEVEFEGYVLPKDTTVVGAAWCIHRDPCLWKEPDAFRPKRFLTAENTLDPIPAGNVITFSVGKRVCPGEQLARMEAFLFLGSILQNFVISGEVDRQLSTVPVNGLALTPQPYLMKANFRK